MKMSNEVSTFAILRETFKKIMFTAYKKNTIKFKCCQ